MPYNVLDEHISTAASHPFKTHKEAGRESWFSAHQPAQKLASALTSLFSETASSLSADYSAHSGCPLGQHSRARERKLKAPRRLLSVTLRSSSNTILQKKKEQQPISSCNANQAAMVRCGAALHRALVDAAKVNWGRDELGLELPWHKRMAGPSRLQITKPHTRWWRRWDMNESQSQPTTNKQSQTMFLYVLVFKNPHLGGPTPPFLSHPTHLVIYLDGPVNKKI